jgi:hypothetical protein
LWPNSAATSRQANISLPPVAVVNAATSAIAVALVDCASLSIRRAVDAGQVSAAISFSQWA